MRHWTRRLFAIAAPLLISSCLWGPGRFTSDLTLKKDGSFILDYRGEIVLQIPDEARRNTPQTNWEDRLLRCFKDGHVEQLAAVADEVRPDGKVVPVPHQMRADERACTKTELAKGKADFDQKIAEKRKQAEQMVKLFGLPGLDDASNRAFAAKLTKYAGWRSVTYRGDGVFDVDYHMEGRATQDFLFPALPDNDLIIPFIAIRRRGDGSVLVTAPAFTGGAGALSARAGAAAAEGMSGGPVSRAQGRFTVITDGEILTNNSEDGPAPHSLGRQVHWDVGPTSNKIPETLIRL